MTAPVRRPDARGDARAGGAPDPGAPDNAPLGERLALRNWSLPVKLAAVLLVPTLFVITLGVLRIVEQTEKARSYDGVQQAVALEGDSARLLGALDGERRAAAVFLATNRAGGFEPVQDRVGDTNDKFARLRSTYESANSVDDQTRSSYRDASGAINQLDRVRDDVQGGRVDPAGAISRYTDATSAVLTFDESLTREAADPSIAGLSTGLYALSEVREQDAYVQAVVASAIAGGRIDAPSIDQARNATLRRSIAVDEFRSAVGTDNAALADAVVGPDVDSRDRLAQVVLGRGSAGLPLQVSAQDWDNASNAVQQKVTDVSDQLRGRLQANAASLQNGARNAAGVASVVLLLALMAGAAVVFFVTRSLLRPLRLLRRTALDVAERRLPAAVRSLREGEAPDTEVSRTPIETREEIGEVARAFDQVHEQAVRLAAEQAGLRTAFNSIFVNLSRRSQALVERQLRLIEQLENKEEDPEALAELFQLDHLATRMRRNSENLLVLSGTDLARRGGRPVPLVDVLRAAASEVEQYQRVELASPPSVQLLGRTAGDVVHLVAELLENAAAFSAPETRVDVGARPEQDGAIVLEISDRGVGMTDQDLAESNQRLGSPPTVDVSASRRMGLFVVGRLAIRHGIGVTLRTRDGGGVIAAVRIPAAAVLSSGPGGRAVGGAPSTRALGGTGLPVRAPGQSPQALPASPTNGSPRPETAGTPIPRQETREGAGEPQEGAGELPRRTASRGGAAAAGAAGVAGAAGAAAFFAPAVDPDGEHGDQGTPSAPGPESAPGPDGDEQARRNGSLASALPRRPMRPDPAPAFEDGAAPEQAGPPSGPPEPAPTFAEHGADDESDDDEDDRVASVVGDDTGDDPGGVTVWSQTGGDPDEAVADESAPAAWQGEEAAAPAPGVPTRAVAAHAWRGPDGRIVEQPDGQASEDTDTDGDGPAGRHGMFAPEPGPQGAPDGGLPNRPRPAPRPDGWSPEQGPPPASRPGPPSHPGTPARPGGYPARPHPGPRPGPGPWNRPGGGTGEQPAAAGQPPADQGPPPADQSRRPAEQGPIPTEQGPSPAEQGSGPTEQGARPTGAPAAPQHPMWNGAEVVPPPGPTAESADQGTPASGGFPTPPDASPEAPAPAALDGLEVPSPYTETPAPPHGEAPAQPYGEAPGTADQAPAAHEDVAARGPVAGTPDETPAPRPSRLSLRPLSQRRQPEAGPLLRPGSSPRLRPRPAQEGEGADATEAPATGDALFASAEEAAPTPTAGPVSDPAPEPVGQNGHHGNGLNGNGQNGHGSNGQNGQNGQNGAAARPGRGAPGPTRTSPENLPRRPAAVLPNRERTPIFDEVASVWFREAEPNDPGGVDPEWADAGHPGFDPGAPSLAAVDAGTTESGLPRRRPRAQLVPGSARPAAQPPAAPAAAADTGTPRRNPDAVRGRLASYQRGVADGRSSRPPQPPDGGPAGEDPTNGPAHRAGPRTDEEEQ
ncbi:nitrate- and nitrite sensing domain-containing protein [Actinomycetospora endophytica]|uniref:histidine kinase n=1 Tax=Actinomycetospora endophytica TaxID=2291215 RepID=A0ABS8P7A5_9PSEU|nr:nitrate- and nitrite sensing domain-containing protein [Actinomycetospora endophytica]MCD2194140.1 nitrate- and nitrite sensing domain-containing protein [Actinomycetospora endophytica]